MSKQTVNWGNLGSVLRCPWCGSEFNEKCKQVCAEEAHPSQGSSLSSENWEVEMDRHKSLARAVGADWRCDNGEDDFIRCDKCGEDATLSRWVHRHKAKRGESLEVTLEPSDHDPKAEGQKRLADREAMYDGIDDERRKKR